MSDGGVYDPRRYLGKNARIAAWIIGLSYKHGTHFEIAEDEAGDWMLQLWVDTEDSRKVGYGINIVHQMAIPDYAYLDGDHFLAFVRTCVHQFEMHEADEWLRFYGDLINDPHATDRFRDSYQDKPIDGPGGIW